MNEQHPELPRGRRRLREPGPATPPPSRPAPRRDDPRASGYQELPQASRHSGEYDLPQPSRRGRSAEPGPDAPGGRRRRLEPPAPLPPAEADFDPRDAERAGPARARHGLDAGADGPAPRRRRTTPDPAEPRRRRPARDEAARRRRPSPEELAEVEARRRQGMPEPELDDVRRRRPSPEELAEAEAARRRRPSPEELMEAEARRRQAMPEPELDDARRRRPSPEELAEAEAARRHQAMLDLEEAAEAQAARMRGSADEGAEARVAHLRGGPADEPPQQRRRGPAPDPAEGADPRRRRAAEPDAESLRRRAALEPEAEFDPRAEPPRRSRQPGDRSAGVPEPGAEPPRRRRPPPPPVRDDPPTDIIPAQAPPEPAHEDPGEFFAEDDEYADYDEYEDDYDEAEYDDEYDDYEDEPAKPRKKKGKRFLGWVAAIAVIALLAGGAYYGFTKFFGYEDFDGAGDGDVLFQVDDGDSTSAIGAKLATAGIVASGKAFVKAGEDNPKLARIQHGFYVMKSHMSGASAVDRITSPASRVGQLEIRPYTQFDDITQPDGKVTPGVYSLLAKATCAQLDGKSTCVSADDFRKAVDGADLKALGVPDWAIEPANKADRKDRRLEGLIAPGLYDVRPGANAQEVLGQLVKSSTEAIQNAGLSPQSTGPGMTPYQTLIIASIIEREAVKADFGKLSRVIYNRLAINMRLQMDSTVNYVLDRPTLLTNEADRVKSGAYNTYKNAGLPPTPISVPSADAIQAAVHPVAGDWVYFVKCEKNGLSCFAVTNDEHNKNRDLARQRGVI
ncbi:endolytic transglycosylase MltG [Amycolatopsis eburnea]|uniref:Endolytic murein transglycosylase n=1 Tax=Amycolatopsis eburnea TaxID=2267691 RepID=A0A3R9DX40_9PSEU|nr:endolytic transglycosylase MltG [Amycolatopsis eburnea]RSD08651.1 endolytic transglycosylase MltG [Amycolatopsis eburnea]